MTTQLTFALSYKRFHPSFPLPPVLGELDAAPILPLMTINYRLCFWRVFERVWKFDPANSEVMAFDLPAVLTDVHVLQSRAQKGGDAADYVLVATLHFEVDIETLTAARANVREKFASDHFVKMYEGLLKQTPAKRLVEALSSDFTGHSSWTGEVSDIGVTHSPHIAAFYHYGWILALRIDRQHIMMNLSTREIANVSNAQTILKNRIQLIQIQRHFLNEDRSNNKELQNLCKKLQEKYKLSHRFERLSRVHRAMEEHLDNTFKVQQSSATRTTNATIRLLTFSAIPIGILSVLLTLNLTSSIFSEFPQVVADARVRAILAVSFLVPFVLVGLAMIIDRLTRNRRD